jgi:DNA invertase Pin-like site-specific DNA recombinase
MTTTRPFDLYVRVSRQGARSPERFHSPELQEDEARAYADARGLKAGQVLADINVSGAKLDRPALDRAIDRIRAGQSAGIIIAHLDRLARTERARLIIAQRIADAGGQVRCVAGAPDDWTTPEGELQVGIMGMVAQYEWRKKSEAWEKAKLRAVRNGIPVNRAPLGYHKDRTGRLVIEPDEARHVRELFEMRARGEGPAAIADYLEGSGVRTSQGAKGWSKQAVYEVLTNHTYLGEIRWGSEVREGAHDPIIDPALFHAAQHPNGHRPAPTRSRSAAPFLLAGILRCAGCRHAMQGTYTSRGVRIYRCTRRHAGGRCQAPARVPADEIEARVLLAFWQLIDEIAVAPDDTDAIERVHELERELEAAERRLAEVKSPAAQEAWGSDWFGVVSQRRHERDEAAAALGRVRAELPTESDTDELVTLREHWPRLSSAEQRAALAIALDCVALRGSRDGNREVAIFAAGYGPAELPRRGFKTAPALRPFDWPPADAGLSRIHVASQ